MDIIIRDADETEIKCDVLIMPVFEGEGTVSYKKINKALDGLPAKLSSGKGAEFRGKHGETLAIQTYGRIRAGRILLVGLGRKDKCSTEKARQAGGRASSALKSIETAALSTALLSKLHDGARAFSEGFLLSRYSFLRYKNKDADLRELKSLTVLTQKAMTGWVLEVDALVSATHFARDLVNTPAKDMTPSALADVARKIKGVKVRVLDRKESVRVGMGAYCAVAAGSHEEPRFIVIKYLGSKKGSKTPPVALIGKAITFDSGGLSLKPSDSMEHMKYDMAGSAAVLGALKVAIAMKLEIDVVAVLPAAENLPGGCATKPGDVVKTITGKTVEILNTDAEGRLALADAIGYAIKFHKPRAVIDIATLTGACAITFGAEAMGLMGNDRALERLIEDASEETGERAWRMPLYDEYDEYIKSDIADLKNIGQGRMGGMLTAGCFLRNFAEGSAWAHLDIAGTAWTDKARPYAPRGATGIGVRLLYSALRRLARG